ncbi:MAG: glutaredoxin 3 [Alphaproteobacteria bacterium HGW-Alphaproteobacteria-18]|nr:MAG: glutaredoxin 3 [Alphaproteobacteria bacterium HGW-Alphaproteobacteria-18]
MAKVTIYTRAFCPYCTRAVQVLKDKGVELNEIDAGMDPKLREEMTQRSNGGRTFPQIFVGEEHIGGCDDMLALDRAGKLDPMLAGA